MEDTAFRPLPDHSYYILRGRNLRADGDALLSFNGIYGERFSNKKNIGTESVEDASDVNYDAESA